MSITPVSRNPGLFPETAGKPLETRRIEGMLPSQEIRKLIERGHIRSRDANGLLEKQIQPASLDLRVGDVGYRVRASFVPQHSSVEQGIVDAGLMMTRVDLTRTTVFEKGCVYIVPLLEELELPDDIAGIANPKSSTGRLDIFTRLITDYGEKFEHVRAGYKSKLYAEICSRTFTVIVRAGMSLNQLRFVEGHPKPSDRSTNALEKEALARDEALVYDEGGNPGKARIEKQSIKLSLNLHGEPGEVVAYKARDNGPVIDLEKINHYDPEEFWDKRYDPGKRGLILDPGGFYILASRERISVRPDQAAEMVSIDQDIGEFRIHYAGFFDPGFGYGTGEVRGTRAVFGSPGA